MIKRRKDYDKKLPSRDSHKVYIVCEGKGTEPAYFSFFDLVSSNLEVITIPPSEGTDPLKLMANAKDSLLSDKGHYTIDYMHGDTVWFVIDTDTWEKEGKIQPLRDFCSEMNASIIKDYDEVKQYDAWNVAQSNPCFEIWLYYHFYDEMPNEEAILQHASFKQFVNASIAGGFDFGRHPAYLEEAIRNASSRFKTDGNGKVCRFSTEVAFLGSEILKFTKAELDKLKNKLG